jgi:4'-phosphopantetheinyl transferase
MHKYFSIKEHHIHIWLFKVSDLAVQLPFLRGILSIDEELRAMRFRFERDALQSRVARGMLRYLLSCYLEMPAAEITFTQGPKGKPYLANADTNLEFNLAHSQDLIVYAFSGTGEVGVDVEFMKAEFNPAVLTRFFSVAENAQLSQLQPEQLSAASYQIWAGKEAVIKALGVGIFMPLAEVTIDADKASQVVLVSHENIQQDIYLHRIATDEGYKGAVAATWPDVTIVYRSLCLNSLNIDRS